MSLFNRATKSPSELLRDAVAASRLVPPDWVFLAAWPLLKAGAVRADVRVAGLPAAVGSRRALVGLRLVDWLAFLAFPRIASRTTSAVVVSGATLVQAVATAEAMRRGRDRTIIRSLAPQLAWLSYATAVPMLIDRDLRRG